MFGKTVSSSYGLRPRRQSESQLERQRRVDELNNYLRRPSYYTTVASDWYLIKIKSNKTRNGDNFGPGQQSPYYFNVKYKGVSDNFYENSIIFMDTWNDVIDIIKKLDDALPVSGEYRDIYDEWLLYLQPRPEQVC